MSRSVLHEQNEMGIKAIIFLQSYVGITETREQAIVGWSRMTVMEQQQTLRMYELLKK